MKIAFEIPLVAKPKAAKKQRFIPNGKGGGFVQSYTPKETRTAMGNVVALCAPHAPPVPFDGPVIFSAVCYRPIPAAWMSTWRQEPAELGLLRPATKPDWDNYAKMICDAFTQSGAWWRDDGQVVDGGVKKYFSARPRIGISIEPLPEIASAVEWRAWKERAALAGGSKGLFEAQQQGTR